MKGDEWLKDDNKEKGKKYEKIENIDMVGRKMGHRELGLVSKNKFRGVLCLKIHMALHSCWLFLFLCRGYHFLFPNKIPSYHTTFVR